MRRGEQGLAGVEALVLCAVFLVGGTLLVANTWAVIDAKAAVVAASREGARALVEAGSAETGATDARRAALAALEGHGRAGPRGVVEIDTSGFARCERMRVTVRYPVTVVRLPLVGGLVHTRVSSTHSELVDPYRRGLPGEAHCAV